MAKGRRSARRLPPRVPMGGGRNPGLALKKKDAFLREILHQIKNHLQVVASLIGLQAEAVKDARVLGLLQDSQNRVRAISLVYEKLYQAGTATRINFAEYLQALVIHLVHVMGTDLNRVRVRMDLRAASLDIRTAIPCGLIVNELVTNALQHAFPGNRRGTIRVSLRILPARSYKLVVADDGVGCPARIDPRTAKSLGLQIVAMLTNQVEGKFFFKRTKGTRIEIVFRQLKYPRRI